MNIYLVQLIGKWINLLLISIISFTGFINYSEETKDIILKNKDTNLSVESKVVNYETITKYNDTLTTDVKNILVEGRDGIAFVDTDGNVIKTLQEKVDEVIEVGTISPISYIGTVTGYGPDCIGCTGAVACYTKAGRTFNLYSDGVTYYDDTFGNVSVLAADFSLFPCGTIIDMKDSSGNVQTGVVLDTGVAMRNAWSRGQVLIDLAFSSENAASMATKYNVRFDVKRVGW